MPGLWDCRETVKGTGAASTVSGIVTMLCPCPKTLSKAGFQWTNLLGGGSFKVAVTWLLLRIFS